MWSFSISSCSVYYLKWMNDHYKFFYLRLYNNAIFIVQLLLLFILSFFLKHYFVINAPYYLFYPNFILLSKIYLQSFCNYQTLFIRRRPRFKHFHFMQHFIFSLRDNPLNKIVDMKFLKILIIKIYRCYKVSLYY